MTEALARDARRIAGRRSRCCNQFDLDGGYDDECGVSRCYCPDGQYLDADDTLAILEGKK